MSLVVVVITGKIGSGKTTLGQCLARRLDLPLVSVGDFVRSRAKELAANDDRRTLQELYLKIVGDVGYEQFATSVLRAAGVTELASPVIVEGVRDVEIVGALREAAGAARTVWLHVEPRQLERVRRASEKGIAPRDLAAADVHPSETHAHAGVLEENADFVISSGDATMVCRSAADYLASAGVV